MAEDKKGFVLYADQRSIIDMLQNDKAGELFKHIFAYVNDENPQSNDALINLAFEPIKLQLKRDLKKWEEIRIKRSEAGKKSAENKRQQNQQVLTNVESVKQTSTKSTVIVNDNVNVNVTVKDKVINKTIPSIDEFVAYAISLKQNVNIENVKLKYNSWLVNDWKINRQGKEKEIKNWKSTLSNTIQFLGEQQKELNATGNKQIDLLLKYKGVPIHEIPFDDRTPVHVYRQIHKGYE